MKTLSFGLCVVLSDCFCLSWSPVVLFGSNRPPGFPPPPPPPESLSSPALLLL
eukprot:COSAG06_NODE_65451_length_257_cov_0.569620_1_plen_52_part_01